MKRTIIFLSLLLLTQLAVAAGLRFSGTTQNAARKTAKLLSIDSAQIDEITMSDADNAVITLEKTADGWMLPEHFKARAATAKVDNLLSTLTGLVRPWPVAKTTDARKRFKVDEQNFERKLTFSAHGKTQSTLLLGSSPGFRKVHARIDGEEQIYDIPFSTFQASVKPEDWVDRQQLQLKTDDISAIELPDCRLVRSTDKLELTQLDKDEQTNQKQARKLLQTLANLQVSDVFGPAEQPLPNPVTLRFKLTLKDGSNRDYAFAKGDKADEAELQVSGFPNLFTVRGDLLKELAGFSRGNLAMTKSANAAVERRTAKTQSVPATKDQAKL